MKETQLLLKLANILKIWLHHIMDKVICDDQIFFNADYFEVRKLENSVSLSNRDWHQNSVDIDDRDLIWSSYDGISIVLPFLFFTHLRYL